MRAQCSYTETQKIPDLSSEQILLDISGAVNNSLSTNSICEVHIKFKHTHLGDFIMQLTSPAGQTITLVGPSGYYGSTDFTIWDISFVRCSALAEPDLGYMPQWDNNQFWGVFGSFDGSYYPYDGCFEDFNTGQVNGVWTLNIIDNQQFDVGEIQEFQIIFCDPRGIDCEECDRPKINLRSANLDVCEGSDLLQFQPNYTLEFTNPENENLFTPLYVLAEGNTVLEVMTEVDLVGYPAGTYTLCVVMAPLNDLEAVLDFINSSDLSEINEELENISPRFCASISTRCMQIKINEPPDIIYLNESFCRGDTFYFKGDIYTQEGDYLKVVYSQDNCDTIYSIHLTEVYVESIITPMTELNCYHPEVVLNAGNSSYTTDSRFEWKTEDGNILGSNTEVTTRIDTSGRYTLIVSEANCVDSSYVDIVEDFEKPMAWVEDGLIDCYNPETQLEVSIDGTYDAFYWQGPNGFQSNDQGPWVDRAGQYYFILTGTNGCIDTFEVEIVDRTLPPDVTAIVPNPRCEDELIILDIEQDFNPNYTYNWTSSLGFNAAVKDTFAEAKITTYYISIFDQVSGCTGRDSFTISTLIDLPTVSLLALDTLKCYVDSVEIINVTNPEAVAYHWRGPGDFQSNEKSPYVKRSGMYYMTTESGNGCDVTESVEVMSDFFIPDVHIVGDTIRCLSDTIYLRATSTDNVEFEWRGPGGYTNTGDLVPVVLPGQYMVKATTSGGCVDSTYYYVVEDFERINLQLYSDTLNCEKHEVIVTFISDEIDSFYWHTSKGEFVYDSVFTIDTTGFHLFYFSDIYGCQGAGVVRTEIDTIVPAADYLINDFGCADDSLQLFTISEAIEYEWSGPDGYFSTESDPWIYLGGEYLLKAKGNNGCVLLDTLQVEYDTIASPVTILGRDFGCNRRSVQLKIEESQPDLIYEWEGPGGFSSNHETPNVSVAGTYTVKVTASNGCVSYGEISLKYDTIVPVVEVLGDTLTCDKPVVTLYASADLPNTKFSWYSNGELIGDTDQMQLSKGGQYMVVGRAANTCMDTVYYELVSNLDVPDYTVFMESLTCNKRIVFPEVNIDESQVDEYIWTGPNNFASSEKEPGLNTAGEYQFSFILKNGCSDSAIYVLTEDIKRPKDNTLSEYTINCYESVVSIDSRLSTQDYFLTWIFEGDTVQAQSVFMTDKPGTIRYIAEGKNGCIREKEIEVMIDTIQPVVNLTIDTFTCRVTKVHVEINAMSDSYSYMWRYPRGETSTLKEPTFLMPGHYTVEVTDTNGCSIIRPVHLVADTLPPVMNVQGGSLSCRDTTFQLKLQTASEIESVRWFGPGSFFSTEMQPVVNAAGEYTVTAIAVNGCYNRDTVYVDENPAFPIVNIEAYPVNCESDLIQVRVSAEQGANYKYNWSRAGVFVSDLQNPILTGDSEYMLTVIDDGNGCLIDTLLRINVDSLLPHAQIVQLDSLLCENEIIRLTVPDSLINSHFSIDWTSFGPGAIITPTTQTSIKVNGVGLYQLKITDTRNGCYSTETIEVKEAVSTLQSMEILLSNISCQGMNNGQILISDVIGGAEPYVYAIEGKPYSSYRHFNELSPGEYRISVKDRYGCRIDSIVILSEGHLLSMQLQPDTTITLGESVSMRPLIHGDIEGFDIYWEPSESVDCSICVNTVARPVESTFYTLTLRDSTGCVVSDSRRIKVIKEPSIYVPSAFTPNDDGHNDFIRPFFADDIQRVIFFAIYERRGNAVFMVEDVDEENFDMLSWDGTVNGAPLSPQVLVYKLIFERKDGLEFQKSGTITLLR